MILRNERLETIRQLGAFCLRTTDSAECRAGGLEPTQAIQRCIELAKESYAVYVGNDLLALWGYTPGSIGVGGVDVWLLTTQQVDKHPVLFMREGLRLLKVLHWKFGIVRCLTWKPYKKAIGWLRWMGFRPSTYVSKIEMYAEFIEMVKEP